VRWYQKAAQQGDAAAQGNLGRMYEKGQGVAQDYKEAVRLYRLAAKQNNYKAQANLGAMYYAGKGVLQDYVRAHMWFNIAAVGGDIDSAKNRDVLARTMTPQQVEQAQRMARECMSSNFTKCD
jgi:TPR repeat protein